MAEQDARPAVAFHPAGASRAFAFGQYRFDRTDRTLTGAQGEVKLPPRVLAVLECLLERPGRVVSKQTLLDAGWPDAAVSEGSLTEAIGQIRQALGDSSQSPQFVQTVHRRGYRFIAPVAVEAAAPPAPLSLVPPLTTPPRDLPLGQPAAPAESPSSRRRLTYAAAGAAVAIAAGGLWYLNALGTSEVGRRSTITLRTEQAPAPGLIAHPVAALSPDGSRIVYVAGESATSYRLFERSVDAFEATPLAETEGAHGPFFSPDGAAIGYFQGGWLHTMPLATRQAVRVAETGQSFGGSWHADGTIVVATGGATGLVRVDLKRGMVTSIPVNDVPPHELRFPQALPDGRTIIATRWRLTQRDSIVIAIDRDTGATRTLATGFHGRWMEPGVLTFLRDESLMARPFPAEGPAVPVLAGVMTGGTSAGQYAVSTGGDLLYIPADPRRRLREVVSVTPGRIEPTLFEPRAYRSVVPSPQGDLVAVTIAEEGAADLWIGDLARGALRKVTETGVAVDAAWSPDGRFVWFGWQRDGALGVYRVLASGAGSPELMAPIGVGTPTSVGVDGVVVLQRVTTPNGLDLAVLRPGASRAEDWLATPASEALGRRSPDGKWVVFQSNRSGRREVYLRAYSDPAFGERQVSPHGGQDPHWADDGAAIVFMDDRDLLQAPFDNGRLGPARAITSRGDLVMARPGPGRGILALRRLNEAAPITTLRLVKSWRSEVLAQLGR